jgi:murein DD-endopeptidase MepM/ murein hydrolase activator NlpD
MPVNWNLGLASDVGSHAFSAFQQGQEAKRQDMGRSALAAYATDPSDKNLTALAPHQPEFVIQQRQQQAKAAADKAQNDMRGIAKLFHGVKDEATYQQSRNVAHRMGIDLTDAPQNYDPTWVQENGAIFNFLAENPQALSNYGKIAADEGRQPGTPEFNDRVLELSKAGAIKTVPYAPGGGVATYNPQTGQTQVIVQPNYGAAQAGAPAGAPSGGGYTMPVSGGKFGDGVGAGRDGGSRKHNGLDIQAPLGSPVSPIAAGVVTQIGSDPKSGTFVRVRHADGTTSSYSHLGAVNVAQGDEIAPGQALGSVGTSGNATGPVLHLVIRDQNGGIIDPRAALGGGPQQSKTVNGVSYYQVNGKWYDNPEGK